MSLLPDPSTEGFLKDLASLVTLLVATANIAFAFGSRRKLGEDLEAHKKAIAKLLEDLKDELRRGFDALWDDAKDCRKDRRDLSRRIPT